MKNILQDSPYLELNPRLKFSLNFVKKNHLKNKRVLDIGCGFGWFELHALKNEVKEIVGLEIGSADLETAKANIKDQKAKFRIGSATKLPFQKKYFDTIVAWEVVEHIPRGTESTMFSEINRVLKDNGVFYMSTPYDSFSSKIFDPAWWLIGHRHYNENLLKKFGINNGLKVKNIYKKGKWWSRINLLNMYVSKWIFRSKPFFKEILSFKENNEYKQEDGFSEIFVKYEKK